VLEEKEYTNVYFLGIGCGGRENATSYRVNEQHSNNKFAENSTCPNRASISQQVNFSFKLDSFFPSTKFDYDTVLFKLLVLSV